MTTDNQSSRIIIRYPPGLSRNNEGIFVANDKLAEEILKAMSEGRDVILPSSRDINGNLEWEIHTMSEDLSVEKIEIETKPRFTFTEEEGSERDALFRQMLADYMGSILARFEKKNGPLQPDGPAVTTVESGDEIIIHIDLDEDKDAALLIGPNKCNVLGLLNFVRMQQIRPHNKVITLLFKSPSGQMQAFQDAHLHRRRGKVPPEDFYISHGVPAPHVKTNKPSRVAQSSTILVERMQKDHGLVNNNQAGSPRTIEDKLIAARVPDFVLSKLNDDEKADLLDSLKTSPKSKLRRKP